MEKTIKHRLYTWFENVPNPVDPNGGEMRVERIAHLGETVDVTDDASLARGEALDAFYSDEDAEAIKNGTFRGPTAEAVYRARQGVRPAQLDREDEEGTPGGEPSGDLDIESASSEEIGEYISSNRLTVQRTIDLVPEDADTQMLEKFYDAETFATENDPRRGVTDYLDAKLKTAAE